MALTIVTIANFHFNILIQWNPLNGITVNGFIEIKYLRALYILPTGMALTSTLGAANVITVGQTISDFCVADYINSKWY
jgi:hypothetical protein